MFVTMFIRLTTDVRVLTSAKDKDKISVLGLYGIIPAVESFDKKTMLLRGRTQITETDKRIKKSNIIL